MCMYKIWFLHYLVCISYHVHVPDQSIQQSTTNRPQSGDELSSIAPTEPPTTRFCTTLLSRARGWWGSIMSARSFKFHHNVEVLGLTE